MTTVEEIAPKRTTASPLFWLGLVLLIVGLLGHLLAARAIGGYYIAYRDHLVGFVGIAVLTGVIIAGLGWRFWRGRYDITMLIFGLVQALFGVFVYVERFHAHM
jgi:hypothetical protein